MTKLKHKRDSVGKLLRVDKSDGYNRKAAEEYYNDHPSRPPRNKDRYGNIIDELSNLFFEDDGREPRYVDEFLARYN